MIEYSVKRSADVLILRRTRTWILGSLAGALLPLAGAAVMGRLILAQPLDGLSRSLYLAFLCGIAFVFYRLLFWGRSVVFDKANDLFSIDGHKICALSDLTSVRMEASQWVEMQGSHQSSAALLGKRLRVLHFRTAQGKVVSLKWVWEGNTEYVRLMELTRVMASFAGTAGEAA